jgi:arginyl-tRNA synthetase
MKFKVESEIFKKFPGVRIGVLVVLGMDNTRRSQEITKLLVEEEKKKNKELAAVDLKEQPKIAPWRQIYQQFGSKPRKFRPSVEALLRRVAAGNKLPNINPLVDLYNYISLKHFLPVGAEDLDKIKGDIVLGFAQGSEIGQYLGSEEESCCYLGEVIYKDDLGFICRRWNWREGDRTKILAESKNVVVVIEANQNINDKDFKLALNETAQLVKKHLKGKVLIQILSSKKNYFDIDYISSCKSTTDGQVASVVPQKVAKRIVPKAQSERKFKFVDKKNLSYSLSKQIYQAAVAVVGKRKVKLADILLEHPAQPEHGDYATNMALRLFNRQQKYPNPLDLANAMVNAWRTAGLPKEVARIEVVLPGFINLWLSPEYLVSQLSEVLKKKNKFGESKIGRGKTVVIDYSAPNIAKPFGIGHIRSTIIGQALYNLYQFLGWQTIGDNHLGDWGTQFGKLIVALKLWNRKPLKNLKITDLVKLYVKFHQEAKEKPKLEDEARAWFKKLEDGNREAKKIWQTCVQTSLKEFNRIYQILGVQIDYAYGEAFYEDKMPAIIKEAKRKKLAVLSRGALVVMLDELNIPPAMLLKSDGATTYATRELACIAYRKKRWQPDLYIYEVSCEQRLYFQQTFAVAVKMGYGKEEQFVHIPHGLIQLPSGKMSTRKGNIIYLEEVLEKAIKKAEKIIKSSETSRGLSQKAQAEVAKAVGIGAVKYFDLLHHPTTGYLFDWQKIFVLEGNSAPYLQYTYTRTQSVNRKARGVKPGQLLPNLKISDEENALLRLIYRFPEVVLMAAQDFSPNLICNYLFDLAQKYNYFYNRQPILKAKPEKLVQFRLGLNLAVGQILKNGLTLLGIETPSRM